MAEKLSTCRWKHLSEGSGQICVWPRRCLLQAAFKAFKQSRVQEAASQQDGRVSGQHRQPEAEQHGAQSTSRDWRTICVGSTLTARPAATGFIVYAVLESGLAPVGVYVHLNETLLAGSQDVGFAPYVRTLSTFQDRAIISSKATTGAPVARRANS